jgi:D-sedoheptulose 7-phosphate isomerase
MSYAIQHLKETAEIVAKLDPVAIEKGAQELVGVRNRGGRLFILGVGGSAANASHAVNDFRKIAGLEVYAPTDNVSELTARTNDDGWASVFVEWLRGSRLNAKDALLILSVGGGNLEKNVSPGFISAIQLAKQVGARVIGIVGKDGGYTATQADACVGKPQQYHSPLRSLPSRGLAPLGFPPRRESESNKMGIRSSGSSPLNC